MQRVFSVYVLYTAALSCVALCCILRTTKTKSMLAHIHTESSHLNLRA